MDNWYLMAHRSIMLFDFGGPFRREPGLEDGGGCHGSPAAERVRRFAGKGPDQSTGGVGCSFGKTSKLFESPGAGADRPALARQGRFGRPGARNLPGSPPPFSRLSRPNAGGVRPMAA